VPVGNAVGAAAVGKAEGSRMGLAKVGYPVGGNPIGKGVGAVNPVGKGVGAAPVGKGVGAEIGAKGGKKELPQEQRLVQAPEQPLE
jgi:hypothetical protein